MANNLITSFAVAQTGNESSHRACWPRFSPQLPPSKSLPVGYFHCTTCQIQPSRTQIHHVLLHSLKMKWDLSGGNGTSRHGVPKASSYVQAILFPKRKTQRFTTEDQVVCTAEPAQWEAVECLWSACTWVERFQSPYTGSNACSNVLTQGGPMLTSPPPAKFYLHLNNRVTTTTARTYQPHAVMPAVHPKFMYSKCTGRRRALCIGINYRGQSHELRGCVNDAKHIFSFLVRYAGYRPVGR
ncbi:hypothetical protein B0H16DRAFT_1738012 [Mycena metata]|uniref:Peptidase C14 caspase domain-containing protein n=1 Tax=Mycena metata TaxID=1033252 RepID=A0AAD7HJD0_9AGAR|nr:hypothetical protein B0H16DRAFT_1738012 [Mycena metata]